jgi:hypothetical protein
MKAEVRSRGYVSVAVLGGSRGPAGMRRRGGWVAGRRWGAVKPGGWRVATSRGSWSKHGRALLHANHLSSCGTLLIAGVMGLLHGMVSAYVGGGGSFHTGSCADSIYRVRLLQFRGTTAAVIAYPDMC